MAEVPKGQAEPAEVHSLTGSTASLVRVRVRVKVRVMVRVRVRD